MLKARIAVFVSGGGTNLQALIDAEKSGLLPSGHICLVVSNKAEAYALERARQAGIPAVTLLRKDCGGQDPPQPFMHTRIAYLVGTVMPCSAKYLAAPG